MCGVTGIILSSHTCYHETKIPRLGHMITSESELGEMLFVLREVAKWILSLFLIKPLLEFMVKCTSIWFRNVR